MKKFLLLMVVGASMMFATNASAQGYIKINPINLAFGTLGAQYEGVVNEKSSFQVGLAYFNRRGLTGIKRTGFGGNIQYRFYLSSDEAPRGLFVAPQIGARFMTYGYDDTFGGVLEDFNYNTITFGALIGYQWLFSDDKFSFELGIGPAYYLFTGDYDDNIDLGSNILPIASLSLGYRLVE